MPTTPTIEKPIKLGLRERIKIAASVEELDSLMAEGATFDKVHPSTVRRWKKAYNARLAKLKANAG